MPHSQVRGREWQPVRVGGVYFGLPMFEFMALLQVGHRSTEHDIAYAKPSMMALANLLSHPNLSKGVTMSSEIEGQTIHRSAKDLGRVLAIAWLTSPTELDEWSKEWAEALHTVFPDRWHELAMQAGEGLRALLRDKEIFVEAHYTCSIGLLAGKNVSPTALAATARQLLQLVVEPLEKLASAPAASWT